jgi:bacterioferritin
MADGAVTGADLADRERVIEEDLVAERIAIETYSEIVRWLANDDPTTRGLMEGLLKVEEEHADDQATLLARFGRD